MSGIEVVGVVLAVWPVMLNVIDAWKAAKGGVPEQSLFASIAGYSMVYRNAIAQLLQDESLSDKDRTGLLKGDEEFAAIWKDAEFQARLHRRLKGPAFTVLQQKSEEIDKILKSLQKKIAVKDGDLEKDKDTEQRSNLNRFKSMRLSLQKKEIKKSLEELRDNISMIEKVLQPYSGPTYAPTNRLLVPHHTHQRHPSEERRARKQTFDDFYEAVCNSFQCRCGAAHEANLRVRDSLELIFPMEKDRALSGTTLTGNELHVRPGRALTLESELSTSPVDDVATELTSMSDINRTTWSRPRFSSISSAPPLGHHGLHVLFDQHVGVRDLVPIVDLCAYLRQVRPYSRNTGQLSPPAESRGILARNGKGYTVSPKLQDIHDAPKVVSMDDCLHGSEMTRRKRLDLALHLTSAIVQFYPTRWIDLTWTWQNFSMLRDDSTHDLLITRRFWSLEQGQRRESVLKVPSKFWKSIRNKDPLLVRLGFALIELAYGKRLSDIRAEPRFGKAPVADEVLYNPENEWQKDMDDWNTANDLVEQNDIRDEVSEEYQKLVATCLQCEVLQDAGMKALSSSSDTFEEDLSRYVVEPLRKYHVSNWGPLPVTAF